MILFLTHFGIEDSNQLATVGDRIFVSWPMENQSFPETVENYKDDSNRVIHCDDNDVEVLYLPSEGWEYVCDDSFFSISGLVHTLTSNAQEVPASRSECHGNRGFL